MKDHGGNQVRQMRGVHSTKSGRGSSDWIVRMVPGTSEAEGVAHGRIGGANQVGLEMKATSGRRQASLALVEPGTQPDRKGKGLQGNRFAPSHRSQRILEVGMAARFNLKGSELQGIFEMEPAFFKSKGHVAVAKDGQTDPGAERGARERSPVMTRGGAVQEGLSERAVAGVSEVLSVVQPKEQGKSALG